MTEYSEKVMDHFMNPRNVGEIADASGVGTVGNAKCGDIMKVYLQIENGVISYIWLWCRRCNQFYGNRIGKRKNSARRIAGDK